MSSCPSFSEKREVIMITSFCDNKTEEVKRTVKAGVEEIISTPPVICRYNESMGGVDVSDHYIATYPFARRTVKWWRKIFFWLLEVVVMNSFILSNNYRDPGMPPIRQEEYRKKLLRQLVSDFRNDNNRYVRNVFM